MINDIDKRVQKALADLTIARNSLLKVVGIIEFDPPPSPASVKDIERLERQLRQSLSPSFRSFLLIQDGFLELDGNLKGTLPFN